MVIDLDLEPSLGSETGKTRPCVGHTRQDDVAALDFHGRSS